MPANRPLVTAARPAKASLAKIPRILLRPDEAAAALGLSPRALHDLARLGIVPSLKLGKLRRFDPVRLSQWATEQSAKAAGDA